MNDMSLADEYAVIVIKMLVDVDVGVKVAE